MGEHTWQWEEVDPQRSGSSGDVSKLFRNEGLKQPGILADGAPQPEATVLAREAIQNSWDAARALAKDLEAEDEDVPTFRIVFRFRTLTGEDRTRFIEAAGLNELSERASTPPPDTNLAGHRKALGLAPEDCLADLDTAEGLRVLSIEEHGTTGMDGPWKGASSKLYLALVSVGYTQKAEGSGGSYGYGKAGLIRGSRTRTVIGYTGFAEREDDPGVTRRLLGMTYWGPHDVGDSSYTGFARLGTSDGEAGVVPLENESADERASMLGLDPRDPRDPLQRGSTFLLLDPSVEPADLVRAVERNWWPALEDNLFEVEVIDDDEQSHVPRPLQDPGLKSFIKAYHFVAVPPDTMPDEAMRKELGPYQPKGGGKHELGTTGLVAELNGWSYAQGTGDDDSVDHQSLIALIRGPRMVVEYYPVGRHQPYVRGVFVADESVDDLLRQTEPKAHDAWRGNLAEEGIDPQAPKVASKVLERVRGCVRQFRKELKPPSAREQDIRLPLLDKLMRDLLAGGGQKDQPDPKPRTVSISGLKRAIREADNSLIRLDGEAKFSLSDDYSDGDTADVSINFRYAFDEDGRLGDECPLEVRPPKGFKKKPKKNTKGTTYKGPLGREPIKFTFESSPYDPDWSGQLILTADVDGKGASDGK